MNALTKIAPRIDTRVRVMSADVVGHIATAQQTPSGSYVLSVRLPDGEILTGVSAADCRYVDANGQVGEIVWKVERSADDNDAITTLKKAVRLGRAILDGRDPHQPVNVQMRSMAMAIVAQGHLLRGLLSGDAQSAEIAREIIGP
jgi:hypothetical protein